MKDTLFVTITPKPGQADAVEAALRDVVVGTRQEPGNRQYDLFRSTHSDRVHFHILERYESDAALAAHRESLHYRAYRETVLPLLEEAPVLRWLAPIDSKTV